LLSRDHSEGNGHDQKFGAFISSARLCRRGRGASAILSHPHDHAHETAAAGGVTDVVARALGERLSQTWGQQVVIENKGGAAHVVGAQSVAKAAPDGYSLLVAEAGTFTINPTLYGKGKLPYDEEKDFIPITGIVRINQALLWPSFAAGKQRARANRTREQEAGRVHLWHRRDRIRAAHEHGVVREHGERETCSVHYRGAAPALTDVIAGHVNLMSVSVSLRLPPLRSRPDQDLRHRQQQAAGAAADIPTVAEKRLPGYEAATWFGLFATAGTPREIVTKINAEVRRSWPIRHFREKFLAPQMFEPMASTPEAFADLIKAQTQKWAKIIREQKLSIDK
jgi:tripartite-type tricarboxylate transporter receptor subunit TctC